MRLAPVVQQDHHNLVTFCIFSAFSRAGHTNFGFPRECKLASRTSHGYRLPPRTSVASQYFPLCLPTTARLIAQSCKITHMTLCPRNEMQAPLHTHPSSFHPNNSSNLLKVPRLGGGGSLLSSPPFALRSWRALLWTFLPGFLS